MILDCSELDCPLSGAKRFKGFVQMARKQLAEQWAERRRQRDEEERRRRVMVITEFDAGDPEATLHALADEILKYRRAVGLLAKAIGWADVGAPFAIISPGRYWRQKRTPPAAEAQRLDADTPASPGFFTPVF
jgi:hypothetical protein